jgi:hypothetical protein
MVLKIQVLAQRCGGVKSVFELNLVEFWDIMKTNNHLSPQTIEQERP